MMSYNGKGGCFPLTMCECERLIELCRGKIAEMELDLEKEDSSIYLYMKLLQAKLEGYKNLMLARKFAEEDKM